MADTLKSLSNPENHGMIVINPDGSDISSAVPSSLNNPAYPTFTRNGSNYITSISMLIDGTTYTKTITRDGSNYITAISAWT